MNALKVEFDDEGGEITIVRAGCGKWEWVRVMAAEGIRAAGRSEGYIHRFGIIHYVETRRLREKQDAQAS